MAQVRNLGCLLLLICCSVPQEVQAQSAQQGTDQALVTVTTRLQTLFNAFKAEDLSWFMPEMIEKVTKDNLIAALAYHREALGTIQRVRIRKQTGPGVGEVELIGENHRRVRAVVRCEVVSPYRMQSFLFGDIDRGNDTWELLQKDLGKLKEKVSVCVCELNEGTQDMFTFQPEESCAIGSSFKVILMDALAEEIITQRRSWQEIIQLQEEGRSLPSGLLQDWPVGSPTTLHTLATLMMARSDNTAADHLMLTIGRENLENHLGKHLPMALKANQPLLRTSELFKLKLLATPEELSSYLKLTAEERRRWLPKLKKYSLKSARMPTRPQAIEHIEWFFSTRQLVQTMNRLRLSPESKQLLPMMAITRPFDMDDEAWSYLGFKGGAELGVFNLTLLGQLKTKGKWYGLSLTWNNTAAAVDEAYWISIAERALRLVERGNK